jgi:hypothetical protein
MGASPINVAMGYSHNPSVNRPRHKKLDNLSKPWNVLFRLASCSFVSYLVPFVDRMLRKARSFLVSSVS